jgi:hypothetical protein
MAKPAATLPFSLVFCTSEDPAYPGRNLSSENGLQVLNANAKGWVSAPSRATEMDQELVFDCGRHACSLQELRILSHECFIAQKVNLDSFLLY